MNRCELGDRPLPKLVNDLQKARDALRCRVRTDDYRKVLLLDQIVLRRYRRLLSFRPNGPCGAIDYIECLLREQKRCDTSLSFQAMISDRILAVVRASLMSTTSESGRKREGTREEEKTINDK